MKRLNLFGLAAAVTFGLLVPAHASAAAPTPDVPPAVTGTTTIGDTLTTSNGTWGNDPTSFTYKWFRCETGGPSPTNCTEITGAGSTNANYVLKTNANFALSDTEKFIRAEVTATNGDGSASALSNAVGPVLSGTVPAASFSMTPRSGSFFSNAFKAANWRIETGASAPNPPILELLPTRVTTLKLPPKSQMTFNPGSMPVCPDTGPNGIGPTTNNSVAIPVIVARCPNAVVGNGEATFLLNRANNPNSSPPSLDGQVIAFNGGLEGGKPRVKFWAYSYDTGVAIYTQGILQDDGTLDIPIPQLSFDSAVNQLNVDIPGRTFSKYIPFIDDTVTIPGGKKADYVQAKCSTGTFPFSADFLLGRRTNEDVPIGNGEFYTGIGSNINCTGTRATAKLGNVSVSGPAKVKRGKTITWKVKIPNTGNATATGVKFAGSGGGLKVSNTVGSIAAGKSKTITVKAKTKKVSKFTVTFKVTSGNAGSKTVKKKVTVTR